MTEMGSDSNYVNYRSRIAYDLFFFLWIGILLFNIVTGLIIDSFAERREEDESRKRIMATECFICGIKNEDYDHEMLPPGSASFRKHCDEEHNQWMYLLFVQYLRNKPACDYDGIEGKPPKFYEPTVLKFLKEQKATFTNVMLDRAFLATTT